MATRAVRMPIDLEARPQRRFEERIALRFPRLRAFLGKLVWRMPNTRLRRGILRRAVKLAWEALNRGDLEVCFALYHRDCVSVWPPEFAAIGLPAGTVGLEERVREQRRVLDDWDDFHFELHEYIDLGDGRLLTVGRMKAVASRAASRSTPSGPPS